MQRLAEVCIKRPVFATMLIMAFVVVGAASWFRLGVDRFPAVDLPTVNVRVELPGASSEEVETQVAQKLEEQINTIQGIQELRSISGPEPEPKSFAARPAGSGVERMPLRAPAIASISSMKPIAPPSSRAALRSSLK
jgi:hypothetical protein